LVCSKSLAHWILPELASIWHKWNAVRSSSSSLLTSQPNSEKILLIILDKIGLFGRIALHIFTRLVTSTRRVKMVLQLFM
jgi:predicted thioredoxin/glutaredoxin